MNVLNEKINKYAASREQLIIPLLLIFFVVYFSIAIVLHLISGEIPNKGGGTLDVFTAGLLWMISISCLIIGTVKFESLLYSFNWISLSACSGALAIDEVFEFHEQTMRFVGDDDYFKIILWILVPIGYLLIRKMDIIHRETGPYFFIGYLIHTFYIFIELGDGDFFTIPISGNTLHLAEEISEMLFSMAYLLTFLFHFSKKINEKSSFKEK